MMKTKERLFQALLFEIVALILLTVIAIIVTGKETLSMTGLAVALSLIAMAWSYTYNVIFDRLVGDDRLSRPFKVRLIHGAGFEAGMIAASFPIIMWATQMGFLAVLILDVGAVVFFFVYAIAFNWAYDIIRHSLMGANHGH